MSKSVPTEASLAVFESYRSAINTSLAAYLKTLPVVFAGAGLPPIAAQALELIGGYTLSPGKRVRGALAALTYDSATGQHLSETGQRLAVVMELIQSYILIMDDVTDRSDLRRGEPTVHRRYEQRYEGSLDERAAEQLAFYTGIIAGHIANVAMLDAAETPARINGALRRIHQNIVTTGFGQLDDIMQEISREATEDEIIRKYALKTSYYTFINPLHAGMALAGIADPEAYEQVAAFGRAAGIAFQARDDYLGIFGGTETGKPNTDDIAEGKLTLLTQHALAHGSAADVATLRSILGNPAVGQAELHKTRQILDRTGATIKARQTAQAYADGAIQKLRHITIFDNEFRTLLAELVTYTINRKS